jgi:hypothetical protein
MIGESSIATRLVPPYCNPGMSPGDYIDVVGRKSIDFCSKPAATG